jgi:hypothetical protein
MNFMPRSVEALLRFKESSRGDASASCWSGWERNGDPCDGTWNGIVCAVQSIRSIHLHNANITADISILHSIDQLEDVDLQGTNVEGPIESLVLLTKLTGLRLGGCRGVTGDIHALAPLRGLRSLHLERTGVHGDISSLAYFSALGTTTLCGSAVTGDVRSLQGHDVGTVSVNRCGSHGHCLRTSTPAGNEPVNCGAGRIVDGAAYMLGGSMAQCCTFTNATRQREEQTSLATDREALMDFKLSGEEAAGSSWPTGGAPSQVGFGWNGTVENAHGDTVCDWWGVTCDHGRVSRLDVTAACVGGGGGGKASVLAGKIEALMNLTHLTALIADRCVHVSGDLAGIGMLTQLRQLSLASTGASGDIAALRELPVLNRAHIRGTQVGGDVRGGVCGACARQGGELSYDRYVG